MLLNSKKKFFAILLVLTMIFQVSMPVTYAGEIPKYVAFEELAEAIRNQTVPVGTTKEAIIATLPTAVGGTLLETATTTGSALSVTVNIERWDCYDFSSEVPGEEYYFIGTPPWPHEIATGVEYPKVKVKIAGELQLPPGVTLVDGATYGGDITQRGLNLRNSGLPDKKMQYKAGSGYVLFTPQGQGVANPTIELNNATIDSGNPIEMPDVESDLIFKGRTVLAGRLPFDCNIKLEPNAKFELRKPDGSGSWLDLFLENKMIIGENATFIINEEVAVIVTERGEGNTSLIENSGSIIVRGELVFEDPAYRDDIANLNISTEDRGKVLVDGEPFIIGDMVFDEAAGLELSPENEGVYKAGNGSITWEPEIAPFGELIGGVLTLDNASFNMEEGSRGCIRVFERKNIPITINVIGENNLENIYGEVIAIDNLKLTGSGNLTVKGESPIIYEDSFDKTGFNGELNAIVIKRIYEMGYGHSLYETAYGRASYVDGNDATEFTVSQGAVLTIEQGANLETKTFVNNGEVINNGSISMQVDVNDANLYTWAYDYLNLKGSGVLIVSQTSGGGISATFTNDGKLINETFTPLDFSSVTEDKGNLEVDGYFWNHATKTLTLQNIILHESSSTVNNSAISLPQGENVTLELKGYNKIKGFKKAIYQGDPIFDDPNEKIDPSGSLTIKGNGILVGEKSELGGYREDVITTTGKLIVESGTLNMYSPHKKGILAIGMEIKGGNIGSEFVKSPLISLGDFVMSGGKIIGANTDGGSIEVFGNMNISAGEIYANGVANAIDVIGGDLTLTGGKVKVQDSLIGIKLREGNFTMTGGDVQIYNSNDELSSGIVLVDMMGSNRTFSITGGTVDIKVLMSAFNFMSFGNGSTFSFESGGMNVTTSPVGGVLRSETFSMPEPGDIPPDAVNPGAGPIPPDSINPGAGPTPGSMPGITVTSFTTDERLDVSFMSEIMIENACTGLKIVKENTPDEPTNPTNPTNPSNGNTSGDSGNNSGNGSSGGSSSKDDKDDKEPNKAPVNQTPPAQAELPLQTSEQNSTKAPVFADTENHWAKSNIEFVTKRGLFGGTGDGKFSPNMPMTRGMFVTVLGKLAKADLTGFDSTDFKDVKSDAYYLPYIQWANTSGIVNGISSEEFAPDMEISREQMAVMLLNYIKAMNIDLAKLNEENQFADTDEMSAWAKESVKAIQMSGILSGKPDNKFDPKGIATRAEVSSMLRRFIEMTEGIN